MTNALKEYPGRFRTWVTLVVQYIGNAMTMHLKERRMGRKKGRENEMAGKVAKWRQNAGGKGFEKRWRGRFLARQMLPYLTVFRNL
jgi:hypothetical protein